MAKVKIPESDVQVFNQLFNLEQTEFTSLINILEQVSIKDKAKNIAAKFSEVSDVNLDLSTRFISTIFSLHITKLSIGVDTEKILKDVIPTFTEHYPSEDIELKKYRLTKIIDIDNYNFKLVAKSYGTINESTNIFYNSKVINDVRPIIIDEKVGAVMLYSNLKISYGNNSGDYKEFFVALDHSDLKKLQRTIENGLKEVEILNEYYENELIKSEDES